MAAAVQRSLCTEFQELPHLKIFNPPPFGSAPFPHPYIKLGLPILSILCPLFNITKIIHIIIPWLINILDRICKLMTRDNPVGRCFFINTEFPSRTWNLSQKVFSTCCVARVIPSYVIDFPKHGRACFISGFYTPISIILEEIFTVHNNKCNICCKIILGGDITIDISLCVQFVMLIGFLKTKLCQKLEKVSTVPGPSNVQ